jgi:general secretion pathway protein L
MAAWLTRCDEPGLNILALTPDVLTLPCTPIAGARYRPMTNG